MPRWHLVDYISDDVDEIAQRRVRAQICVCEWSCYIRLTVTPSLCRRIADERKFVSNFFRQRPSILDLLLFPFSTWTWSTTNIKVVLESNFLINAHLSHPLPKMSSDFRFEYSKSETKKKRVTHRENSVSLEIYPDFNLRSGIRSATRELELRI